jgi:hypothetical protein
MLVLLNLLVADGNNFTVKHHLVHGLHIVLLFVNQHLRLGEQASIFLLLLALALSWGHLVGTLLVALHHTVLAGYVACLLSLKLRSIELFGCGLVLFTLNGRSRLHTVDVAHNEHSGLASGLFNCFFADAAEVFRCDNTGSLRRGHSYKRLATQRL